ncbi:hypothetical protein CYMTET_17851 [Cymbomonas tetramitiformis]|uniref:Uncharacterized protein n=1 Tax=Cymbomonas tetramitiformis TaxID=36881 RepID=A0AAE0G9A2_9CHLO|nr:hypothetical protein CYMTET_17851 [Cymbomonas tetramitiformis]
MGGLPDRIDWGDQETLSLRMVKELMSGHWHEDHRTILSRKCAEQKVMARELRTAPKVQALMEEEVEKRGDVAPKLSRAQAEECKPAAVGA